MATDFRSLDDINRRLELAADELRALAQDQAKTPEALMEQARRRVEASARVLALLADQQRLRLFSRAEQGIREKVGRSSTKDLLVGITELVANTGGPLSCGVLLGNGVCNGTALVASRAWTDRFARWHAELAAGPGRCPLLAVRGAVTSIVVDRIALAGSWPEWRARALANGWRSAAAMRVQTGMDAPAGALLLYSKTLGMAARDLIVAERAADLAGQILRATPRE